MNLLRPLGTMLFIATLALGANVHAETTLSAEERRGVRDRIVSEQAKIENLYVRFRNIARTGDRQPREERLEWAISGQKRYLKSFVPGPVGGVTSERWVLALWDGRFKKTYDSATNSGTLRDTDNPVQNEPVTFSPYAQNLGHLSLGTMTDLFAKVPLEDWEAQRSDDGKRMTFTTDRLSVRNPALRYSWTFDTTKGYMISGSRTLRKDTSGQWRFYQTLTVLEDKEVRPGIWLPTMTHVESLVSRQDGSEEQMIADYLVDEIKVNDPAIENLFHFDWPTKAQYYDYILGRNVNVDASSTADRKTEIALILFTFGILVIPVVWLVVRIWPKKTRSVTS